VHPRENPGFACVYLCEEYLIVMKF